MLVSWNWLKDYVAIDRPLDEVVHRLTMSGLNLESVEPQGSDTAIDLEVTSNRPDCLGHLGVAREVAALYDLELNIPDPQPNTGGETVESATSVDNQATDLCPRYLARVIRGVKVGPSPDWLRERLAAIGQPSVNNVVDITNYVLMECGQPLHAFDLDRLDGKQIVVRSATAGEKIKAIDQREYELRPGMCVIADASRPVAVAGVMGGFDTEIADDTINILIETAAFQPLAVRNTARALNLHSPSSYRFERGVDLEQLDWASRRCCELIQQVAGGELLDGVIVAGDTATAERPPVPLRFAQIGRLLGIDVDADEADRILRSLGLDCRDKQGADHGEYVPPSWRRDISREVDLIEEVARIHGYDRIPANAPIDVVSSAKSLKDRISDRVRETLTALGVYEAITLSFVSREQFDLFKPLETAEPLAVDHSSRRHENLLRQSLVPSLLQWRRENEKHGTFNACLFELAKVYLSTDKRLPEDQAEPWMISLVGGWDVRELRGMLETLARRVNRAAVVELRAADLPCFTAGRGAEVLLNGERWGLIGELPRTAQERLDLRDTVTVAEVRLANLLDIAELKPRFTPLPQYPAVERDLNFVLPEAVSWQRLETVVRETAGELLETVRYEGQYRGKQIPPDAKSYLMTLSFRSPERTLTGEEVDRIQQQIIAACQQELQAQLR